MWANQAALENNALRITKTAENNQSPMNPSNKHMHIFFLTGFKWWTIVLHLTLLPKNWFNFSALKSTPTHKTPWSWNGETSVPSDENIQHLIHQCMWSMRALCEDLYRSWPWERVEYVWMITQIPFCKSRDECLKKDQKNAGSRLVYSSFKQHVLD